VHNPFGRDTHITEVLIGDGQSSSTTIWHYQSTNLFWLLLHSY